MNLQKRSYKKELLDSDDIPFQDIKRNMQELNFINTWLGGHDVTRGNQALGFLDQGKCMHVRSFC